MKAYTTKAGNKQFKPSADWLHGPVPLAFDFMRLGDWAHGGACCADNLE